jgi:uncharacterized protein (UPF0212 family)
MEETFDTYAKAAIDRFGDKVTIELVTVPDDVVAVMLANGWTQENINELKAYQQVWIKNEKCPNCGTHLNEIFGGFTWGIVHGEGTCSNCRKVSIRFYHYFGNKMFQAYALIGF